MRRGPGSLYRRLQTLRFLATRDRAAAIRFLGRRGERRRRLALLRRFMAITNAVRGYHTLSEMLTLADAVLERGRHHPPLVVECGVGLGSSTAKLAVAAASVGGRVVAFDSFRGIPANREVHRSLDGRRMVYREGAFRGREAAVRRVLEAWGEPVVELRRGWFAATLYDLDLDHIDVAVLDVDLVASTRICVATLYPRLARNGVLFTQDGHLEATVELLGDPGFWRTEVGVEPPVIKGLGRDKLLAIPRTDRNVKAET
jgi:O-methyltransferase